MISQSNQQTIKISLIKWFLGWFFRIVKESAIICLDFQSPNW
jgi:hypothetical protein